MASLSAEQVALIDQRIRAHAQTTEAWGTCQARDATGPGAKVTFDGSTLGVDVIVAGHVMLRPGMRCTLNRYGSEWVVTNGFATPVLGRASMVVFSGSETTTSSSFADLTSIAPLAFTKLHSGTLADIDLTVSAFSTAAGGTTARWALRFTQIDGDAPYTPADLTINYLWFSIADTRFSQTTRFTSAEVIPAGSYSVQVRWRRASGSGTVTNVASNDHYSLTLAEVVSPSSPYV